MKETKKKVYKTEVMQFTLHPLKLMEFTTHKKIEGKFHLFNF